MSSFEEYRVRRDLVEAQATGTGTDLRWLIEESRHTRRRLREGYAPIEVLGGAVELGLVPLPTEAVYTTPLDAPTVADRAQL